MFMISYQIVGCQTSYRQAATPLCT